MLLFRRADLYLYETGQKLSEKISDDEKSININTKRFIIDIWQCAKYASE